MLANAPAKTQGGGHITTVACPLTRHALIMLGVGHMSRELGFKEISGSCVAARKAGSRG